jgi:hypothetical protein
MENLGILISVCCDNSAKHYLSINLKKQVEEYDKLCVCLIGDAKSELHQ